MKALLRSEDGVTAIEYALIAALIFLVIIGAVGLVGGKVTNTYGHVASEVTNAMD
jgi:pilus assembly protein Flp/PilA